jgi:LacI family transcriptional regulator
MPRRVTMADVAREAGVSLMTVSRVINNKEGISDTTRTRILEIIKRLDYRPSDIARGLVTNRTGTLGLVVPDNSNPFFSEVARGAEHVAYAAGYNVFLCNTEEDKTRELAVMQSLEEKRVDGIIVCSSRLEDSVLKRALSFHPTAVLVNRSIEEPNIGVIEVDDKRGALMATEHLIRSGHTRIGMLAGPDYSYSGQLRISGYRAALEAAGIDFDPELLHHCTPKALQGKAAALELLGAHPDITALFCYNDLVAVGALQACAGAGRRVPEDCAIVGFDDTLLALLVTPPLTTCYVPSYDLGRQAMELLLQCIKKENEPRGRSHIIVQPEIRVRESAP